MAADDDWDDAAPHFGPVRSLETHPVHLGPGGIAKI